MTKIITHAAQESRDTILNKTAHIKAIAAMLVALYGGEIESSQMPPGAEVHGCFAFMVAQINDIHAAADRLESATSYSADLKAAIFNTMSVIKMMEFVIAFHDLENPFGMHTTDGLLMAIIDGVDRIDVCANETQAQSGASPLKTRSTQPKTAAARQPKEILQEIHA